MKENDSIFLSASVPYREAWIAGTDAVEIEEAVVSLARAVFARGGRLLFGGHPSISPLVSAVAGEYYEIDPQREIRPVVTFQSEWFRGKLPDETWEMHRMGFSAIEWTPKAETQATSLTIMREWMLGRMPPEVQKRNQLAPPCAMVVVGGMEGCLEEAAIFFRQRREWSSRNSSHLYAFASGGGAASKLSSAGDKWEEQLSLSRWVNEKDAEELRAARRSGDLLRLEESWRAEHADFVSEEKFFFPPYASIAQWLVDRVE